VDYVIIREGLGIFCPLHLALSLNRNSELCASFFIITRQISASFEHWFVAFVVRKL